MHEGLKFGLHLDALTQEDLDEIVSRFVRNVTPGLRLPELLGEHPLKIGDVREAILKNGVLERRWDGQNDFRIQANPYSPHNPLISFSFEPYVRDNPRGIELIARAKIFEMAVSSHLLARGIAVEIV